MTLKSILRSLVPPALWAAARPFKQKYRVYPSWAAAAAAAGSYEADVLNRFRVARGGEPAPLHDNALSWLLRMFPGEISIVDFGGSVGEVGKALEANEIYGSYTVVENPTLVSMMEAGGSDNFTSTIPQECDIFYSSGTLQCIPEPYLALDQGFKSAKKAVVLKRNNFCERDYFIVHMSPLFDNGSGPIPPGFSNVMIAYPSRTVKESEVTYHRFNSTQGRTEVAQGIGLPFSDCNVDGSRHFMMHTNWRPVATDLIEGNVQVDFDMPHHRRLSSFRDTGAVAL